MARDVARMDGNAVNAGVDLFRQSGVFDVKAQWRKVINACREFI